MKIQLAIDIVCDKKVCVSQDGEVCPYVNLKTQCSIFGTLLEERGLPKRHPQCKALGSEIIEAPEYMKR